MLNTAVGREAELSEIFSKVRNTQSWTLSAGRRFGKTTLARMAASRGVDGATVLYVDKQSLPAMSDAADLFENLISRISGLGTTKAPAEKDIAGLEAAISSTLRDVGSICLILDEVESLAHQAWGGSVLENLRYLVSNSSVTHGLSVGLIGGPKLEQSLAAVGSSIANVCWPVCLLPMERDDIGRLVDIGAPKELCQAITARIWEVAGGHPFVAQALLEAMEAHDWIEWQASSSLAAADVQRTLSSSLKGLDVDVRNALLAGAASQAWSAELTNIEQMLASGFVRREDGGLKPNGEIAARVLADHALDSEAGPVVPESMPIQHNRPYSNARVLGQVLLSAMGSICWVDKHAGVEVIEFLMELPLRSGLSVRVLSTRGSANGVAFRAQLIRAKGELASQGVSFEWQWLQPEDASAIHDRYLIVDSSAWNVPPSGAVLGRSGQRADFARVSFDTAEFDGWWARAIVAA